MECTQDECHFDSVLWQPEPLQTFSWLVITNSAGCVSLDGCSLDVLIILITFRFFLHRLMQLTLSNGACWSHLKHLKNTNTLRLKKTWNKMYFYIKQYCDIGSVRCVHTMYLVWYCEINAFIPEREVTAHCMVWAVNFKIHKFLWHYIKMSYSNFNHIQLQRCRRWFQVLLSLNFCISLFFYD